MVAKHNRSFTSTWFKSAAGAIALTLTGLAAGPVQAADAPGRTYPAYQGPKKTIAVAKFDAVGSFVGRYGGWDIGGGLAAMLTAELARTNRFVVVERGDLDTLLREKQMALSDVTRGTSGGSLLGAQTFIHASVTEFDQQEKGGGLNLGLTIAGVSGGAARRQSTGHVAIVLRLIDGESGAVIATSRVEKTIRGSSVALQARANMVSFGGDSFDQTSLGLASRQAIEEAVAQIVTGMERVPFQALIAKVDGERVFINAGRNANILPGARLRVTRATDRVTDPLTGEVLGENRQSIADIVIEQVEDRYAIGSLQSARWPVQRADVVQLIPR